MVSPQFQSLARPGQLILIWITPDTTRYLATLLGVSYLDTHTLPCSRIRRAIRARLRNRKQHFLRLHIRRHLRLHRHPLAIVHDLLSRRVVASVAQRRLHLRRRLLPPDPGTRDSKKKFRRYRVRTGVSVDVNTV